MHPYLRLTWRGDGEPPEVDGLAEWHGGHRLHKDAAGIDDGVYAGWRWHDGVLQVANDRYGFYPLFYYHDVRQTILSPSLLTLLELGVPTEINAAAVAVFLRLGWFLGQDTPFRAIQVLPPAAVFRWERGTLKVDGGLPAVNAHQLTKTQAIDTYIELFRQAIACRVPEDENWAAPLSGGRDSRHILLELHRQGLRPRHCLTTHTYPVQPGDDVSCARAVSEALGIAHVAIPPSASMLDDTRVSGTLTHLCSMDHTWLVAVLRHLQQNGVRTIYDGIGGDVLSAGLFLTDELLGAMRKGDTTAAARLVLQRWFRNAGVEKLLSGDLRRQLREEVAVERIAIDMQRHLDAPNPVASFHFWSRTRRYIALLPFGVYRDACTAFCPYLDHRVYDLLAGLPPEHFLDHTFHTQAIERAYPKFAGLPYTSYRPRRSRWTQAARCLPVLRQAWQVSPGKLPLVAYWTAAMALRLPLHRLAPERLMYLLDFEARIGRLG